MNSNFVFLDRLLFEFLHTHTHRDAHTDTYSGDYSMVEVCKHVIIINKILLSRLFDFVKFRSFNFNFLVWASTYQLKNILALASI